MLYQQYKHLTSLHAQGSMPSLMMTRQLARFEFCVTTHSLSSGKTCSIFLSLNFQKLEPVFWKNYTLTPYLSIVTRCRRPFHEMMSSRPPSALDVRCVRLLLHAGRSNVQRLRRNPKFPWLSRATCCRFCCFTQLLEFRRVLCPWTLAGPPSTRDARCYPSLLASQRNGTICRRRAKSGLA
jgi:hypothetical protein